MKKYILFIVATVIMFSCGKTVEEKQLEVLKAKATRTEAPKYDPWDIGVNDVAPTHAHLRIDFVEKWVEGETEFSKISVNLSVNSGYADIRAISLVIDYAEDCSTILDFDKSSIHSDLTTALSTSSGAMLTNITKGKFYFAYYCLAPMTVTTSGGEYSLLSLTFKDVTSPAPVIFDRTPGNVEFSIDGYNNLILSLEDYEL